MIYEVISFLLYVWPFPIFGSLVIYWILFNVLFINQYRGYQRAEIIQSVLTLVFAFFLVSELAQADFSWFDWHFWWSFHSKSCFYLLEITTSYSVMQICFAIPYFDNYYPLQIYPLHTAVLSLFCNWIGGQMILSFILFIMAAVKLAKESRLEL